MYHAELKVTSGKQAGSVIPLPVGKFLIGREEDCHLRPNSDLVSRHHCVFTVDEFAVRVRDLGSTNGTLVNGERIRGGVMLNAGDVVSVGKIDFEVVIRDPSQETATHMAFESDTQLSERGPLTAEPVAEPVAPPVVEEASSADTIAEMKIPVPSPAVPPVGDTQLMNAAGMPMPPTLGYPQMGYPQMMPPYGYPAYPGMYPQPPMGYPMPGMYPQAPMPMLPNPQPPVPDSPPPGGETAAGVPAPPVKLPNPEDTGAKAPPPKPTTPDEKSAAAKSKEEAPKRADDIIQQYLKRRPTTGGK